MWSSFLIESVAFSSREVYDVDGDFFFPRCWWFHLDLLTEVAFPRLSINELYFPLQLVKCLLSRGFKAVCSVFYWYFYASFLPSSNDFFFVLFETNRPCVAQVGLANLLRLALNPKCWKDSAPPCWAVLSPCRAYRAHFPMFAVIYQFCIPLNHYLFWLLLRSFF